MIPMPLINQTFFVFASVAKQSRKIAHCNGLLRLWLAMTKASLILALIYLFLMTPGCRGFTSPHPPIHPNPNMDTQQKGKAYRESDFFADGMVMRNPILGTVAFGQLNDDKHIDIDEAFMLRGQQVYNRTCAACHSLIGDGEGLVGKRLLVKPTSFHSEYMYNLPPSHYFNVINNGIRTMSSYGEIVSPKDAWAIVAYIRALQMSQDIDGEWIKRSSLWWTQK